MKDIMVKLVKNAQVNKIFSMEEDILQYLEDDRLGNCKIKKDS